MARSCSECDRPLMARGYCMMHYKRYRKSGVLKKIDPEVAAEERIWSRVDKQGPAPDSWPELGSCWLWTGTINVDGYGKVSFRLPCRLAHRVVYERLVGPIQDGLQLDHLCRVRNCVNPNHLEPVTSRVNSLRGEGLAAQNVIKTHCPAGHLYDAANLSPYTRGGKARYCRTCNSERSRRNLRKERSGLRPVGACPKCKEAPRTPGRSYCRTCSAAVDARSWLKRKERR